MTTGHGFRLPPEIAAGRRGYPAANEIRDLYTYSPSKHVECGQNVGWILSGYNVDGMLEVSLVGGTDY